MSKKLKIKWVEPRVVNLEQLPTSLGACSDGNTAATGGGPPGQQQCKNGGTANKQCKTGGTVL